MERWRGGAMVALVTAFALPLWWRIDDSGFEAVAVLAQPESALDSEQGRAQREELESLTERITSEGFAGDTPEQSDPDASAGLEPLEELGKVELSCRARNAAASEAVCARLITKMVAPGSTFQLEGSPRVGRARSLLSGSVMLLGAGTGIAVGLLWMLLGALFSKRGRPAAQGQVGPATVQAPAPSAEELSLDQLPERWSFALWPPRGQPGAHGDAMQLLCDEAERLSQQGGLVIGVSSGPEHRVRKAYAAAQFASLLAARRRPRVLLLEADFEEPAVDRVMQVNMPPMAGFSQQLQWRDPANTALSWTLVQIGSHLSVLAEGRVRVLGQYHSQRFAQAIAQLRRQYDVIVIDGPPLGVVADTKQLDIVSGGIIFVASARTNVNAVHAEFVRSYAEKPLHVLLLADPV